MQQPPSRSPLSALRAGAVTPGLVAVIPLGHTRNLRRVTKGERQ
jgi:hypothetical protein